jgi:hypothetical protein
VHLLSSTGKSHNSIALDIISISLMNSFPLTWWSQVRSLNKDLTSMTTSLDLHSSPPAVANSTRSKDYLEYPYLFGSYLMCYRFGGGSCINTDRHFGNYSLRESCFSSLWLIFSFLFTQLVSLYPYYRISNYWQGLGPDFGKLPESTWECISEYNSRSY